MKSKIYRWLVVAMLIGVHAGAALLLVGCSTFVTVQTDVSYDEFTGAKIRQVTTKAKARTFFDAKSQLANFKATQTDKTQSAAVGAISQETSGTNAVAALEQVNKLLLILGVKSAVPGL